MWLEWARAMISFLSALGTNRQEPRRIKCPWIISSPQNWEKGPRAGLQLQMSSNYPFKMTCLRDLKMWPWKDSFLISASQYREICKVSMWSTSSRDFASSQEAISLVPNFQIATLKSEKYLLQSCWGITEALLRDRLQGLVTCFHMDFIAPKIILKFLAGEHNGTELFLNLGIPGLNLS